VVTKYLPRWPPGQWIVYVSIVLGAFFAVQQAATGSSLYLAFLKGVGAAAAAMVLAGLAERLHAGDKIQAAQLPGGAGARFETSEAAAKTREGVEQLNARVTAQSEQMITIQAQLDRRVSDLEAATFKDSASSAEHQADEVKFHPPKSPGRGELESR
jgi:hypothetical protein